MINSVGIVLRRSVEAWYKIFLVDKKYGRINSFVNTPRVCVGSAIAYDVNSSGGNFFISNVECLYAPIDLAAVDLLFLHHVVELLYYFAPVGSSVDGIFDLLAFLYAIEPMFI